jgi:hypothetical protein
MEVEGFRFVLLFDLDWIANVFGCDHLDAMKLEGFRNVSVCWVEFLCVSHTFWMLTHPNKNGLDGMFV